MSCETILVVHGDPDALHALARAVEGEGRRVHRAPDAEAALAVARRTAPDLVVAGMELPGADALDLLECLREGVGDVEAVLVARSVPGTELLVRARRSNVFDVLVAPTNPDVIGRRAREALRVGRMGREASAVGAPLDPQDARPRLVGESEAMLDVRRRISDAAVSREPVLILGETGTGKELVARAIHHHSDRADGPFEAARLGNLPEGVAHSVLFGHVKGAFTGARSEHRGWFARASRGTLFLDEVGELKLELQPILLGVLEEGEFMPMGGEDVHTTDARIIAATNRPLLEWVEAGRFRRDLYHRLHSDVIVLPPLQDRMEDVEELAEHLLARAAHENDATDPPVLTAGALDGLHRYAWPGNVRELEKCLRRAWVRARRGVIRVDDISFGIRAVARASGRPPSAADRPPAPPKPGRRPSDPGPASAGEHGLVPWLAPDGTILPVGEVHRRHILATLRRTGGNVSEAARRLGLPRSTLRARMRKLGIEAAPVRCRHPGGRR